jgi:hypothetical protein
MDCRRRGDRDRPGRGYVHPARQCARFANHGADAKFLAVASPGVFGPAYFREIADDLSSDDPPDIAALAAVMRRHGLTPAAPSPA